MKKTRKLTGKIRVDGSLQVAIFREGRTYVALAPALDLVAQGKNIPEARKHFEELFNIYLEETISRGTLEADLRRNGWQREANSIRPPMLSGFPPDRGQDIQLKALVIVPLSRKNVTCPA